MNRQIEKEFKQTEEYKAKILHKVKLEKHRKAEAAFDKEYGKGEYKYCYDVFGTLRNPEYLEELKSRRKQKMNIQDVVTRKILSVPTVIIRVEETIVTHLLHKVPTQMMKRNYFMKFTEWHLKSFIQMYVVIMVGK